VVGPPGFEPGISRTRTANRTKLDHGPDAYSRVVCWFKKGS
jgi:hypothetical protein